MSFILVIAFIAGAVLALPNPGDLLLPRDFPQSKGLEQGSSYDNLTFTIYSEQGCKGNPSGIYTGSYGFYEPYQMQSYDLSRPLLEAETLDFFSGPGEFDSTKNGHYTEVCLQYSASAGINATDDTENARLSGCHTLKQTQWCAILWEQNLESSG